MVLYSWWSLHRGIGLQSPIWGTHQNPLQTASLVYLGAGTAQNFCMAAAQGQALVQWSSSEKRLAKPLFLPMLPQKFRILLPPVLAMPYVNGNLEEGSSVGWLSGLCWTKLEAQIAAQRYTYGHDQRSSTEAQAAPEDSYAPDPMEDMARKKWVHLQSQNCFNKWCGCCCQTWFCSLETVGCKVHRAPFWGWSRENLASGCSSFRPAC